MNWHMAVDRTDTQRLTVFLDPEGHRINRVLCDTLEFGMADDRVVAARTTGDDGTTMIVPWEQVIRILLEERGE